MELMRNASGEIMVPLFEEFVAMLESDFPPYAEGMPGEGSTEVRKEELHGDYQGEYFDSFAIASELEKFLQDGFASLGARPEAETEPGGESVVLFVSEEAPTASDFEFLSFDYFSGTVPLRAFVDYMSGHEGTYYFTTDEGNGCVLREVIS